MMRPGLIILALVLFTTAVVAQDLKKIDVQLSCHASGFTHSEGTYYREALYIVPELQVLFNINRHISVGGFYNQSVSDFAEVGVENHYSLEAPVVQSDIESVGILVKAGSNRLRRARFYVVVHAASTRMADHYSLDQVVGGNFTVSRSGLSYGAGFGLTVKVSHAFSFNVFEVRANYYSKELDYINDKAYFGGTVGVGFSFHLFRKK